VLVLTGAELVSATLKVWASKSWTPSIRSFVNWRNLLYEAILVLPAP